jgi:hypothetical protein
MNSRTKLALSVAGAAMVLAACTPPHPHPHPGHDGALRSISALDCPQDQEGLTRTDRAADGKSCNYADSDGALITLQLVSVSNGDSHAALAPIETKLRAELPAASADAKSATGDKDEGSGRVDIDLPGIHIHANKNGGDKDDAEVNIGSSVTIKDGKTVVTDNHGGGTGVVVNAHDKGAEIHVGEAGGGVREVFVLTSETPGPHGFKLASYEARGPSDGPLVVASILSKSEDHDDLKDSIRDLLRRNVGG